MSSRLISDWLRRRILSAQTFGTPSAVKMMKPVGSKNSGSAPLKNTERNAEVYSDVKHPNFRAGYSLIELLVVIAVITIIGITSFPSIFNRNDRLLLDSSASQVRQVIIEAQTRAQAPDKNDSSGAPQVFQVSFGKFTTAATTGVESGTVTTNNVVLERGLVQCDTGDLQGGFTTLRNITLPRGIFVSSFYPSNQNPAQNSSDDRAIIRFAVGDNGFSCGSFSNPIYKSGQLFLANWSGLNKANVSTVARYLVVTLASQKVGDKRYVTLDRVTRQVAITRSNPQSYFTPVVDNLAPKWNDVDPNKFTLSVTCGTSQSDITISYPRAKDRVNIDDDGDPNLFVAYNINWKVGILDQPLAIRYFYDLTSDTVRFQFTTDLYSVANQARGVTVTVWAVDDSGHIQGSYAGVDDRLLARQKLFSPSCGSVISNPPSNDPTVPPTTQSDPGGNSTACNGVGTSMENDNFWRRLSNTVVGRANASFFLLPC